MGGHNDGRPGQLSAMVLAGDVLPHCGGFHVWPGAPKRLYPLWQVRSPALPRPSPVATAMKSDGRGLRRRRRGTRRVLSRRRSTSWRSRRCATQYRRRRSSARPGMSASGCAPRSTSLPPAALAPPELHVCAAPPHGAQRRRQPQRRRTLGAGGPADPHGRAVRLPEGGPHLPRDGDEQPRPQPPVVGQHAPGARARRACATGLRKSSARVFLTVHRAQFAEDTLPTAENMWENWAI